MSPLRVLAVDDEPLALKRLECCLVDCPDVEVVGSAHSGRFALELVRSLRPDVLLLDIAMPELDGFAVLESLDPVEPPEIIFVTAFDKFAVRAFERGAADYLLKPVHHARLIQALDRARGRLAARACDFRFAELHEVIANLRRTRPFEDQRYHTEFWVSDRNARIRIPVEKIDRIEASGDYVRIRVGELEYLLRAKLADIEHRLDPGLFVRIHRCQIVRRELIVALRRNPSGRIYAVLGEGTECPVSRSQLPLLRERLSVRLQFGRLSHCHRAVGHVRQT